MTNEKITLGSQVEYKNPMADEIGVTYTVVEIEESTNWCKISANVGMNFNPTYVANISDLKLV